MAVTDTQQWTMQSIGDKIVELGNGQHSLKTDLMNLEDRLAERFDALERDMGAIKRDMEAIKRDMEAIKRHLGVPDDA